MTGLVLPDQGKRWPAGDDEAGTVKLQQGVLEDQMRLLPRSWFTIRH